MDLKEQLLQAAKEGKTTQEKINELVGQIPTKEIAQNCVNALGYDNVDLGITNEQAQMAQQIMQAIYKRFPQD